MTQFLRDTTALISITLFVAMIFMWSDVLTVIA